MTNLAYDMKWKLYFLLFVLLSGSIFSCSAIKESRYAGYNSFSYTLEQPRLHFRNDTLKIEGEFYWGSTRAIPKASFLPRTPKRILAPIARRHGAVLFSSFDLNRKKYSVAGFVPVSKKDVRFSHPNSPPLYIIVLISEGTFTPDTLKYKPRGRNNDYQFELYASEPHWVKDNYWLMEVIAAEKKRYYNFVCILDDEFMGKNAEYQANLYLEDIKLHFAAQ